MMSQTAIDELDSMIDDGLAPTPKDIVLLNSLGLKLEAATKKHAADSIFYLPRVAKVSDTVWFRQPTIGHDIWFDRLDRVVSVKDVQTVVALRAFALSRSANELPDPENPETVIAAVREYGERLADLSIEQVMAAIDYCMYGADSTLGETVTRPKPEADEAPVNDEQDWELSVAAGMLAKAQVCLFGVSVKELREMTQRQVRELMLQSYVFHHLEVDEPTTLAQGDFVLAVTQIRERLTKEREEKGKVS